MPDARYATAVELAARKIMDPLVKSDIPLPSTVPDLYDHAASVLAGEVEPLVESYRRIVERLCKDNCEMVQRVMPSGKIVSPPRLEHTTVCQLRRILLAKWTALDAAGGSDE